MKLKNNLLVASILPIVTFTQFAKGMCYGSSLHLKSFNSTLRVVDLYIY